MRSANPPARVSPVNDRPRAQRMSSPIRQAGHRPHDCCGWQITGSPTATSSTADPTSRTQPVVSWPRVSGSSVATAGANQPSRMCTSVRHSPAPATRTMTSCGLVIVGSGMSSSRGASW